MPAEESIIIIRKKKGHAGHHGGAWKVAYADFVTALMALFIVLWLMNSSKPVQEAVSGYFNDPKGFADKKGAASSKSPAPAAPTDLAQLKEEILKKLSGLDDFSKLKDQIEIIMTQEGLRIELMENKSGTFFEQGSAKPKDTLQRILVILAVEAGKLPNPVSIEGHTDATNYADDAKYGNWELSTDRANMARRIMVKNGLKESQVVQVRGYADRKLRNQDNPQDPSNRRVTILIQDMRFVPANQEVFNGKLHVPNKAPSKIESAKPK
jgi:chemotaxis protein MotB